ncbi:MAG: HAMP domain-containing sensor histidine kinase [Litorimonas sp.]
MLAELLLFVPSAALFRQSWLMDRADQAGLLAQVITGIPDFEASEPLRQQFMEDTDILVMSTKHDGITELILGGFDGLNDESQQTLEFRMIDLRQRRRLPRFSDAFVDFFGSNTGYLRVITALPTGVDGSLQLIIPREKLRLAMRDYFLRVFWLSLLIALITGCMIYFAMSALIINPVKRLASDMTRFRENPNLYRAASKNPRRKDEIGQLDREFIDMKQSLRASFRQRERLAGLGLSVAKINHDLRNVLTSALMISDRLAADKDERIKTIGDKLTRNIERGVGLTEDVLAYSKAETADPVMENLRISFLLGEVAADVVGQFKGTSFKNKVPSELLVHADPDHAYRIFNNLFRNAAQAMQSQDKRVLSVAADVHDGRVNIMLTDTGPGLPDKARNNLFQAFKGGQGKGSTGLGLTISKELSIANGGDINLVQSDASGTRFQVTLNQGI